MILIKILHKIKFPCLDTTNGVYHIKMKTKQYIKSTIYALHCINLN